MFLLRNETLSSNISDIKAAFYKKEIFSHLRAHAAAATTANARLPGTIREAVEGCFVMSTVSTGASKMTDLQSGCYSAFYDI